MTRNDSQIVRHRRHLVLLVLRALGLLLTVYGVYQLVHAFFLGVGSGWDGLFMVWDGRNWVGTGLGVLIPGVALMVFSRRLSVWIVPAMRLECPQCAYPLQRLNGGVCPECGYPLDRSPEERAD